MTTGLRFVALPLVAMLLAGCTSYVQRSGDPARIVRTEHPRWVLVGAASAEMILYAPRIEGDRLIGAPVSAVGEMPAEPAEWQALDLEDVDWIGTERNDRIQSLKALIAIGVASFIVVIALIA